MEDDKEIKQEEQISDTPESQEVNHQKQRSNGINDSPRIKYEKITEGLKQERISCFSRGELWPTSTRGRPLNHERSRRQSRKQVKESYRTVSHGGRVSSRQNNYISQTVSDFESEDERDYHRLLDIELPWKNEIRQGRDYQVSVPECRLSNPNSSHDCVLERGSTLLWPGCGFTGGPSSCPLPVAELKNYLRMYHSLTIGVPLAKLQSMEESLSSGPLDESPPDDEAALRLLMECSFKTDIALKKHERSVSQKNYRPPTLNVWSEDEATAFEKGFAVYGKNFYRIREHKLRHRSVSDIIEFYYVWKKTQRSEDFLRRCGRDRRKFLLEPGLTDSMDCFVLDDINLTANYCLQSGFPGYEQSQFPDWSSSSFTSGYCEDVQNLLRCINYDVTEGERDSSVHPLAHLPKPELPALNTSSSSSSPSKGHTNPSNSNGMKILNITADECPILCSSSIGGSWSLTYSPVTLRDLKHELQSTGNGSVIQVKTGVVNL